jgi:hypothetical protein
VDVVEGSVSDVVVLLVLAATAMAAMWLVIFKAPSLHPRIRLRHSVILWLGIAVALFVLIPESRAVAEFQWNMRFPDEMDTEDGATALVSYALVVSPLAYLPYMWIAAGLLALVVRAVHARQGDS